jgi:hypothetical protein
VRPLVHFCLRWPFLRCILYSIKAFEQNQAFKHWLPPLM